MTNRNVALWHEAERREAAAYDAGYLDAEAEDRGDFPCRPAPEYRTRAEWHAYSAGRREYRAAVNQCLNDRNGDNE